MEFRIADTFTDSLARLTSDEQKAVKTTAFDLQINPANPGLNFHRIDKAKDPNFWSVRVNLDLRAVVHKTSSSLLLCYVAHHDKAYAWAEKRKIETHPTTGAAQIVEIRETVKEIVVPKYVEVEASRPPIFKKWSSDSLLKFGVPADWIDDVAAITSEDQLLALVEHLPAEAADALLIIADGGTPDVELPPEEPLPPYQHPDALRRFRVMNDVEELKAALEFPWEKWTVFLHPAQRAFVERTFNGPARVSGSAGTGKTIVAIHRAVKLATDHPDGRVLLTTFSSALANNLRKKLRVLASGQPGLSERIEVHSIDAIAKRLYELKYGKPNTATRAAISELIKEASITVPEHKFTERFLLSEWFDVVDAWRIQSWEAYRDFARLGRKTRLPEKQREIVWSIFDVLRERLKETGLTTDSMVFERLTKDLSEGAPLPFDFAVVDEAQDISPSQLRFLAALAAGRPNALFFAGDLGQRIFQQAFSWRSLGVDIRGRSRTLKVNYRTSHQIRSKADRLLGAEVADVDGLVETRKGTISIFNGAEPEVRTFDSVEAEIYGVSAWVKGLVGEGVPPDEIAIFVRSESELERAASAVAQAGFTHTLLDTSIEPASGNVSIGTMSLAKGLEFRAVAVMACDDEIVPSQERIESVTDEADLQEVYDTERHLLYVACTRARENLLVTSARARSEFLDDMVGTKN